MKWQLPVLGPPIVSTAIYTYPSSQLSSSVGIPSLKLMHPPLDKCCPSGQPGSGSTVEIHDVSLNEYPSGQV